MSALLCQTLAGSRASRVSISFNPLNEPVNSDTLCPFCKWETQALKARSPKQQSQAPGPAGWLLGLCPHPPGCAAFLKAARQDWAGEK